MINCVKIFVGKTIGAEKSILVICLINISLTLAKHSLIHFINQKYYNKQFSNFYYFFLQKQGQISK